MVSWNATFNELSFKNAGLPLDSPLAEFKARGGSGENLRTLLRDAVQLAGQAWGKYLKGSGTIDVQISIDPSTAREAASNPNVLLGQLLNGVDIGNQIAESYPAYKIITGKDPNGSSPEVAISLNPNFVKNNLWLDPGKIPQRPPGPLDLNTAQADAVSTFMHEIGHGLAVNGMLPALTQYLWKTPFDQHVIYINGAPFFGTENATKANETNAEFVNNDHPVPLLGNNDVNSLHHLGGFDSDVLSGTGFQSYTNYHISSLDLAILADCGLPVDAPLIRNLFGVNAVNLNKPVSVDQVVSAQDPDKEPITWYAFKSDHVVQKGDRPPDGTLDWFNIDNSKSNLDTSHFQISTGYRFVDGQPVPVSGDQPTGEVIYIPASELHNARFIPEGVSGLDELYFSAYDGHMWGPELDISVYSAPANGPSPSPTPTVPPGTVVPPTFYVIGGIQNPTTHGISLPPFSDSLASGLELSDLLPPIPMEMAKSAAFSAGSMTSDLATAATDISPILGQPDALNTVLHLPG